MTNLVEIRDLNIRFTGERTVHAVNDLSLSLGEGEVLGLLGESGSGKSVTLRALMRLLPKKRTQISGSVRVLGRDVLALDDEELSAFRGQTVSMIFQEPALALDPVYTIGQQISETVVRHEGKSQTEARSRALEMLEVVRIPSANRRRDARPAAGNDPGNAALARQGAEQLLVCAPLRLRGSPLYRAAAAQREGRTGPDRKVHPGRTC